MEILTSHERNVRFTVPSDLTQATFKLFRGDVQIGNAGNATVSSGVASVPVKFPATATAGELTVELTFIYNSDTHVVTKQVDVVTPLLERFEILDIHPDATEEEIWAIEAAVRHIIQAHTGQRFGRFSDTFRVRGSGGTALMLPERIISLNSVNGIAASRFILSDTRWSMAMIPAGYPPVKADYYGLHMHTDGVIHNPNNVRLGEFTSTGYYNIDAEWGYEFVPEQVKEAAKLLINDYACAEQSYRDRFLSSMTAADWRIAFDSRAWVSTGNARADMLLKDYVRVNWLVV